MQIIKIDCRHPNLKTIKKTAEVLKNGGVVVYPTDTVYGLGVDALNEEAIEKLFAIKTRPRAKPLSIIVKDLAMARKYTCISKKVEKILERLLPGPITVVLRKKENLPHILTAGRETIGLRMPDYPPVSILSKLLPFPFTTTSANISGYPPSGKIFQVSKYFKNRTPEPDLILDAGDLPKSKPSTVIDLTTEKPKILRAGPISKKELFEIMESLENI